MLNQVEFQILLHRTKAIYSSTQRSLVTTKAHSVKYAVTDRITWNMMYQYIKLLLLDVTLKLSNTICLMLIYQFN